MSAIDGGGIPVKLYKTDDKLTVAAPMPGVEPQDIEIEVNGDGQLELHADARGYFKGIKDVMMDEWNPGPYHRRLSLSTKVDASRANASYDNGVLVVSMPVSSSLQPSRIELKRLSATEGRRQGFSGQQD